MSRNHETIEELLAVQALGGLDGDDLETLARERAAHGDCAECRRLEDGFAETAGRMAFALTPEPVDPAIADRIVGDELSGRRERRSRGLQALVAVAAALAVVVLAVSLFGPGRPTAVTAASPTQQIVAFEGVDGESGELAMAFTPGQTGAVFFGTGLPDPGPGKVLEIWMFQGGEPVSSGCVSPRDGVLATHVDADVGASEAMAVTVEPTECPSAPTSQPIFTADVPAIA
jgi:hypothetical protein